MNKMSLEEKIATALAEINSFRIQIPRLADAQSQLSVLRILGRKLVGDQQKILSIIGPSQSGKSTIIKDWKEKISREEAPRQGWHPIVHVTLTPSATQKSLGVDIIQALGDDALPAEVIDGGLRRLKVRQRQDASFAGPIPAIMMMAKRCLWNAKTEVLILDELHHLVSADGAERTRWSVSEQIKTLTIGGVCPIVCVGERRAEKLVQALNNPQFAGRSLRPIYLRPLDMSDPGDAQIFLGFVAALENLLVDAGVIKRGNNFLQWAACFYDVSKGVIGLVSHLIGQSIDLALRAGRDRITREDLADATDLWAIALGYTNVNPWRTGPRDFHEIRILAENL